MVNPCRDSTDGCVVIINTVLTMSTGPPAQDQ